MKKHGLAKVLERGIDTRRTSNQEIISRGHEIQGYLLSQGLRQYIASNAGEDKNYCLNEYSRQREK
jgi:hypothetical protein